MRNNYLLIASTLLTLAACTNQPKVISVFNHPTEAPQREIKRSTDQTLYGYCGESTTLDHLELILDNNARHHYSICPIQSKLLGGANEGDKLAVIIDPTNPDTLAVSINITTMMGKWKSSKKGAASIELYEDGAIRQAENNDAAYLRWEILNGALLLTRAEIGDSEQFEKSDTFTITALMADTLLLTHKEATHLYYR